MLAFLHKCLFSLSERLQLLASVSENSSSGSEEQTLSCFFSFFILCFNQVSNISSSQHKTSVYLFEFRLDEMLAAG